MDAHRFFVEKVRFHLKKKDKLVFVGWFFDGTAKGHTLSARLDGEVLPLELFINRGAEVRQKYLKSINEIQEEVVGIVTLPADWRKRKTFSLEASYRQESSGNHTIATRKLRGLEREISYYIENCHYEDGKVTASGWCMADGEVKLVLTDGAGKMLVQKTEHYYRKDLLSVFPECEATVKPGFLVQAEVKDGKKGSYCLEMRAAGRNVRLKLRKWDEGTKLQYLAEKAGDTVRYFQRNGFSATMYKINSKLRKKERSTYDTWKKKYEVTPEELERQRREVFKHQPVFSLIVPVYRTKKEYLIAMIESVCAQTYPHWQLCIADGSCDGGAAGTTELTAILEEYARKDTRIQFCTLANNEGISGNSNAALAMASGDFVVLVDHDDLVAPSALYEFAAAQNRESAMDVIYSDEDKVSMDGRKYFEPHFKPDFNLDLLCSMNYICHLFGVKREIANQVGGFDEAYDGAQDLDFILRCTEIAQHICHVPKILYHWRSHLDSTAANPESKLYAFEAGRRAVEAHYRRLQIPARVENAQFYGMYHTIYEWRDRPLVSVIIPNKDHAKDLETCICSIWEKSEYRNLEFIIVENNSTEQETFAYYDKLEAEHENMHVVYYEGGFNYSKINNFGARAAKGEYLLLLNNDTEMINKNCIWELLGYCMREDVGAVGAKLLYEDETIQHAGVVAGFGGTAGHAFIGKSRYDTGYFGRILCAQNYSAVTAACMMTKRSVFDEVGGLTEELAVAFNDVDYCLKVQKAGKLVVYNPYAELFHYESKSRGYEDSPEKVERFNGEVEKLLDRWRDIIEKGDPYYNPNLTLDNSDFSLRR